MKQTVNINCIGKLLTIFSIWTTECFSITTNNQLQTLLQVVKQFSENNKIEFGFDKYAQATFQRGKIKQYHPIEGNLNIRIRNCGEL